MELFIKNLDKAQTTGSRTVAIGRHVTNLTTLNKMKQPLRVLFANCLLLIPAFAGVLKKHHAVVC
jgi:hypothetical protein